MQKRDVFCTKSFIGESLHPYSANQSGLVTSGQPLRPRNQFHHPLDVAGPFGQIRGGFGGVALEGVGKAGGNEGRLSGGEF